MIRNNSNGDQLSAQPSGYVDDPGPLPVIPAISCDKGQRLRDGNEIITVPSEDGSMKYRLEICSGKDGQILAVVMPLDDVNSAVSRILNVRPKSTPGD